MKDPLTKEQRERIPRAIAANLMGVHIPNLLHKYEATVQDLEQQLDAKDAAGRALVEAVREAVRTDGPHPSHPKNPDRCLTCEALEACPPEWKEKP